VSVTAAVTEAAGEPFVVQELEIEEPRPGELLVRIAVSGICHTDLTVRGGTFPTPLPAVLGHEGAGVVEKVGSGVTAFAPGDHVALSYDWCDACAACASGRPFHCHGFFGRNFGAAREDGSTALSRNGTAIQSHFFGQSSFATHAVVPQRSAVKIGDDVPFEYAAPLGCGIQTGAGSVMNVLKPGPGSTFLVTGVGGVGLAAVMAASIMGAATIIAADLNTERLELARELGATHTIDPGNADLAEEVEAITGGGVELALEASGSTAVLRTVVDALASGGTCGVVGAPPFGEEAAIDVNTLIGEGRSIRGIVEGHSVPSVFIPLLIDLWRAGKFPVDRLVRSYDLDAINDAAADAERGTTIKPVLVMG
jgi:aryl-alcohol dehydrogenase